MKKFLNIVASIAILTAFTTIGCSTNNLSYKDKPITLSIWHVYGSQTKSPMNDIIEEFNQSVGKEKGIVVEVTSISDSTSIDEALVSAEKSDTLPDMFTAYPRIVDEIDKNLLLNWNDYFSEKEINEYVDEFLLEGYFDDELLMFPIAKSTELFFLNKTIYDRFSTDTDFSDFNTIFDLCNDYYDYSNGKAMLQINDYYHYFYTQIHSLGGNFIENNKINADSKEFETVFMPIAKAAIYGGVSTDDGYASDKWKTAELISSIGSTAGIMYMRDYVTYENGEDEDIKTAIYPYPTFEGAQPTVIQRGTGIFGVRSDDEKKNEAIALFVKWITSKEQNLELVTEMGYLPVKKAAFDELFDNIDTVKIPKHKLVYETVLQMYDDYTFLALPLYEDSADIQYNFEESFKSVLKDAHTNYTNRVNSGADKEKTMDELLDTSLESLKSLLQ